MGTVAQILSEEGRIAADLARRQGEVWSNFAINAGNLPGQIQQQSLQRARERRLNQQAASEQALTDLRLRGEQRAQQEQSALDQVWGQDIWNDQGEVDVQKASALASRNGFGHLIPHIRDQASKWAEQSAKTREAQTKADEANAALDDRRRNSLGVGAIGIDPTDDGTFSAFIGHAAKQQWINPDDANRYLTAPPEARKSILDGFIRQSKDATERLKPIKGEPGTTFFTPDTMQPIASVPEKAPELQAKSVLLDGKPAEVVFNPKKGIYQDTTGADVSARVTPIPPASAVNIQQAQTDASSIADAIEQGLQPPDVKGLYRMAGPVRAELSKRGYDLTRANLDWQAAQKHVATLNGAQQTRLRQAISTASDSLGVIEDLAKQWDAGKFPILNKAQLALAVNGALGPKAQQIATNLQAQITDVTSELGNVYMGGNSPTDHALSLAQKNLSADWTRDQLLSAIQLARTNLKIRQNSIDSIGAAGLSTAPTAGPKATHRFNPATGKIEPIP